MPVPPCPVSLETRLTPEHAISHCPRFANKHRNAEPADVNIGSKADDSEVEEYGELEEDPGLGFGSSFASLFQDFRVEVGTASLATTRLLVGNPLVHLTGIEMGEPPLVGGVGCVDDCAVG